MIVEMRVFRNGESEQHVVTDASLKIQFSIHTLLIIEQRSSDWKGL